MVEEIHRQVLDPNADLGDLTATEFAGREEWTDGNADAGRRYAEARAAERAKRRQGAGALAERVVRGPADLDEWLGPEPQENAAQADARVRRDARLKRIDDAATGGFVTDPIV